MVLSGGNSLYSGQISLSLIQMSMYNQLSNTTDTPFSKYLVFLHKEHGKISK